MSNINTDSGKGIKGCIGIIDKDEYFDGPNGPLSMPCPRPGLIKTLEKEETIGDQVRALDGLSFPTDAVRKS